MKYYLAPLEGITTYIFRNAYFHHFGDLDKYYTPFIANKKLCGRDKREILPENNAGIQLIPQILSGRFEEFLSIAQAMKNYGYKEVNLNLGCPSATVFSRNRGSGALKNLNALEAFLDAIFSKCELSISAKTRIGVESLSEWEDILKIYQKFPFCEIIVHPRLREEYYKGKPHIEAFSLAKDMLSCPLTYNGDIFDKASFDSLISICPDVSSIMLGRGILYNPNLVFDLKNSSDSKKDSEYYKKFKAFHTEILNEYIDLLPNSEFVLYKMKDLWAFMIQGFPDQEALIKQIRRADNISSYKIAVNNILSSHISY